jgi:hypothetical protein
MTQYDVVSLAPAAYPKSCRIGSTRYGILLSSVLWTTEPARHTMRDQRTVFSSDKRKGAVILSTSDYQTKKSCSTVTTVTSGATKTVRHPRNKQGSSLSQAQHKNQRGSDLPPSRPTGMKSMPFPATKEYLRN